jgi:transcriptional regulator with XRE-family HTH domain
MSQTPKRTYSLERNYEAVGEFLRAARSNAGLTQLEVADALGYSSPQFISNFEAGIAVPPLSKIVALERIYKFDVMALMKVILDTERSHVVESVQKKTKLGSTNRKIR